ncbi:alpha/beta fold hydrolase [Streptomyces sp. NPDC018031]|uniref:alpha/beta fold hydrolase n=1 Tax=Streptomyces sp. NPDC018031 TaxID=3365033 RepID=UPI0037AD9CC1
MPQSATTRFVTPAPGVRLWTETRGAADGSPLLLVMGGQASGLCWPEGLVERLAAHHRVIRYDHRDTGRSSRTFDQAPYRVTDLAADIVGVLDGLGVERAHLVGMSLGGMLTQLVLADHPDRVLSATLFGTTALSTADLVHPDGTRTPVDKLPGIDPRLLEEWARPIEDLGPEAELDRRVRHWELLHGDALPFDADYFRTMEREIIEHTGRYLTDYSHARADDSGMLRTEALAANRVPTLVVSAPADPVFPPPHPQHLAQALGGARLTEIPGLGHSLPPQVHEPLAEAILSRTGAR